MSDAQHAPRDLSGRARPRRRRALALVPLAVIAAAWTQSSAPAAPVLTVATPAPPAAAPSLPTVSDPASVSRPTEAVPTTALVRDTVVSEVGSVSDIPTVAQAAYHRAEAVLATAAPDCRISWELVAAVGRVESDHGRHAGSRLTAKGVARPAILGPRLDGTHDTARLRDTDAGLLDDDTGFDRAVGPMQFIPSTWAAVGVDADGDGRRNPQDVDDAALAAAVYLCSGGEDLSTDEGRRSAVHRYNHSDAYVDLVLRVMVAYEESVSATTAFSTQAVLSPGFDLPRDAITPEESGEPGDGGPDPGWVDGPRDPDDPRGPKSPGDPEEPPEPKAPPGPVDPKDPHDPEDPDPGSPGPGLPDPEVPSPGDPSPSPAPAPTPPPTPTPTPEPTPTPTPVDPGAACADLGYVDDPAVTDDAHDACVAAYPAAAQACLDQGLVDDPAAAGDAFDGCLAAQLPPLPVPTEPAEPSGPTEPAGTEAPAAAESTEPTTGPTSGPTSGTTTSG